MTVHYIATKWATVDVLIGNKSGNYKIQRIINELGKNVSNAFPMVY